MSAPVPPGIPTWIPSVGQSGTASELLSDISDLGISSSYFDWSRCSVKLLLNPPFGRIIVAGFPKVQQRYCAVSSLRLHGSQTFDMIFRIFWGIIF